jgi:hypothetical protein
LEELGGDVSQFFEDETCHVEDVGSRENDEASGELVGSEITRELLVCRSDKRVSEVEAKMDVFESVLLQRSDNSLNSNEL